MSIGYLIYKYIMTDKCIYPRYQCTMTAQPAFLISPLIGQTGAVKAQKGGLSKLQHCEPSMMTSSGASHWSVQEHCNDHAMIALALLQAPHNLKVVRT